MTSPTPSGHLLTVRLHDGTALAVAAIDGGGAYVGQPESYEIHGYYADGDALCVRQSEVAEVVSEATGEPVSPDEWGNPHFPGHPHYQPPER